MVSQKRIPIQIFPQRSIKTTRQVVNEKKYLTSALSNDGLCFRPNYLPYLTSCTNKEIQFTLGSSSGNQINCISLLYSLQWYRVDMNPSSVIKFVILGVILYCNCVVYGRLERSPKNFNIHVLSRRGDHASKFVGAFLIIYLFVVLHQTSRREYTSLFCSINIHPQQRALRFEMTL